MQNKKVIIEMITSLSTDGAQMMLYNILLRIDRKQFCPIVFSLVDGELREKIESLGIPVYLFNMKRGRFSVSSFWHLIHTMRKLRPDLLHSWMYHANLIVLISSLFIPRRIPLLWSIHSSVYSLIYQKKLTVFIIKLGAFLSKYPSYIHYVSQISASGHEAIGYHKNKSVVIPNAIDTEHFVPLEEYKDLFRSELCLQQKTILIGLVGRYHPIKDHDNFLRAASLLLKRNPYVHFVLVGNGINWENKTLQRRIQSLNIRENIHLLGKRQDISHITASLDIACSTSYSESFSMSVGEAMSCGVTCVATEGANPALITGDTGIVVPPQNPEVLAEAWHKLIQIGHKGRQQLGRAARKRIEEKFSLSEIVSQYELLYKELLTGA